MKTAILTIQVVSLVLIVVTVLLQQRGTGLSGVFGGSSSSYQTKRGAEKLVFYVTIFSALAFFLVTIWSIFAGK